MQLVFMYEIGKYPKHSGSESDIRIGYVFASSIPLGTSDNYFALCVADKLEVAGSKYSFH